LGLLAAPWVYAMLFNALFAFPLPFAAVVTPLLLAATLDLGLEAFARLHGFKLAHALAQLGELRPLLAGEGAGLALASVRLRLFHPLAKGRIGQVQVPRHFRDGLALLQH
jgi:hypothetical protein